MAFRLKWGSATLQLGKVELVGNVQIFPNAGAPTNGVTGAGVAGPGSLCIDTTNKKLYINTGTLASPAWTVTGTQT